MKRLISLLFALGLLFCAARAEDARVFDYAGLLTGGQRAELEAQIADLRADYDFDFVILTTDDSENKTAWDYAADFYDYGGFGEDGLILAVCMDQRMIEGVSSGWGEEIFTPRVLSRMYDRVVDSMSDGDYMDAFERYIALARRYLSNPDGSVSWAEALRMAAGYWPLALLAGLLVGGVTVLVMRARMKTGRKAVGAAYSVKDGSFQISSSQDLFLYSTFTRVKIDSGSSGRGGRFTGSSGRSHSHGGGRF